MTMRIWLLAAMLVALAGCGGGETPAPTQAVLPSATPAAEVATGAPESGETPVEAPPDVTLDPTIAAALSTMESLGLPTLPPPGTLLAPTPLTPEADLMFTMISFSQRGGPENTFYAVQIYPDGTVIRDGVTSRISAQEVQQIDDLLDEIGFFHVEGIFTGANFRPNESYEYMLQVDTDEASKTIYAQDGMMPPELIRLMSAISNVGLPVPNAAP